MDHQPPRTTPIAGDCYEASFKNAKELAGIKAVVEWPNPTPGEADHIATLKPIYENWSLKDEIRIVHGWVTPKAGPAKDRRVHHAWIEIGALVIETQGGMRQRREKSEYYATFTAEVERRYSVDEADALIKKFHGFGAWDQLTKPISKPASN